MTDPTPAEIEAALARATPGPWGVHPNYEWADSEEGMTGPILSWDVHGSDCKLIVEETEHEPNAALIAAAPGWLRWLLDRLAESQQLVERLTAQMEPCDAEAENAQLRTALEQIERGNYRDMRAARRIARQAIPRPVGGEG